MDENDQIVTELYFKDVNTRQNAVLPPTCALSRNKDASPRGTQRREVEFAADEILIRT